MPTTITKEVKVDIVMSGKDVADLFWKLSTDEKAEFFNYLSDYDYNLVYDSFNNVLNSKELSKEGLLVFGIIEALVERYYDWSTKE